MVVGGEESTPGIRDLSPLTSDQNVIDLQNLAQLSVLGQHLDIVENHSIQNISPKSNDAYVFLRVFQLMMEWLKYIYGHTISDALPLSRFYYPNFEFTWPAANKFKMHITCAFRHIRIHPGYIYKQSRTSIFLHPLLCVKSITNSSASLSVN